MNKINMEDQFKLHHKIDDCKSILESYCGFQVQVDLIEHRRKVDKSMQNVKEFAFRVNVEMCISIRERLCKESTFNIDSLIEGIKKMSSVWRVEMVDSYNSHNCIWVCSDTLPYEIIEKLPMDHPVTTSIVSFNCDE